MNKPNTIGASIVVAMVLLLACSSSQNAGGEICDNGGGGINTQICGNYATQAKCSSQTLTMKSGHPCTMFPSVTVTPVCCVLDGCTGDISFLNAHKPSDFPAGPQCGPQDAGGGG
jgi:hypothetical protein